MNYRVCSHTFSILVLTCVFSVAASAQSVGLSKASSTGYGIEFDLPGIEQPDSLTLSLIHLDSYRHLIQFDQHVLVIDSITGFTIRLFSQEEYRKKSASIGLEMASPFRYFAPSKLSED